MSGQPTTTVEERNLAVTRAGWAAWTSGDLEATLAVYHPDVEFHSLPEWPEDPVYYGRAGVRRFFEQWLAMWEDWEGDMPTEYAAVGDHVMTVSDQRGRAEGSVMKVEMRVALISLLHDGLVVHTRMFPSRDEAVAAARAEGVDFDAPR